MIDQNVLVDQIEALQQDKDASFEITEKIQEILRTKYSVWQNYKDKLLKVIRHGILWCDAEEANGNINQLFLNPNWLELKAKYLDLNYEIVEKGLSKEDVKKLREKYLKEKLIVMKSHLQILKHLGLTAGQTGFYYPKLLEIANEIQNKFGNFVSELDRIRHCMINDQTKSQSEYNLIDQCLEVSESKIDSFLMEFSGNLLEQFKKLSQIDLPSFQDGLNCIDHFAYEITSKMKSDQISKAITSLSLKGVCEINVPIYKINIYGDSVKVGNVYGSEALHYFAKERLWWNFYQELLLKVQKLYEKWIKTTTFKYDIINYFTEIGIFKERIPFITKCFDLFIAGNRYEFACSIMPQIEGIMRDLLHFNGIMIYKEKRHDMIQEYIAGRELLVKIKEKKILSDNLLLLLEVSLYDPMLYNLRNDLLHGFKMTISDFDLYLLLLILFQLTRK